MAKNNPLVLHYLEDISWRVLEEYPQLVAEIIRGRAGIYVLFRREKLYYIGLARNLKGRLNSHLRDRHHGAWDRFSVYLTIHDEHMKELEALLLRIVTPSGNKSSGKFAKANSLIRSLNRSMRESDADRRARMLGGRVARQRRRQKTRRASGSAPLAGVVERRIALQAKYAGGKFRATLRKNGMISYRNASYESPSAAAHAATGKSLNGWIFWQYRRRGKWLPLAEMRK